MSINNIELNEINLIIDETKDMKVSDNNIGDIKIKKYSGNYAKNNFSLKASLFIKETLSEIEFKKYFKMTTREVEFKDGMFYKKVKLILESNKLTAFDNVQDENAENIYFPLLVLNFDQITAEVSVIPDSNKFTIYVLGSKKVFQFRAEKREIFKNLLYYLNYFINSSNGSRTNLLGVSLRNDFYKVSFRLGFYHYSYIS